MTKPNPPLSMPSKSEVNERPETNYRETPLPFDFWHSPSLDQLAAAQGVQPMSDITALFGSWPGEIDDNFEESILKLRRPPYYTVSYS